MPTARRPPPDRRRDLGRAARSCTWSGARPTWRSRSRSRRSRRSSWRRCASASPGSSSSAGSRCATPRRASPADPPRAARHGDRRGAAARRRHGHGRLGRADHPVGDRGPAHRADAGLGRRPRAACFLGERLPRLAVVGIVVGFVGVGDPRRPDRARARPAPSIRPALAAILVVADRLVVRLAVRLAPGEPAAPPARRDRAARCSPARSCSG